MKIVEVGSDSSGIVELDGSRREANLSFLTDPKPGEYVMVHAGFAIERLDERDANERIAMFRELAENMKGG